MNHHKTTARIDRIGITASTLCAIHCAVVPLVFTGLPLIGLSFLALPLVEWGMIIFALMIGLYSIGLSYLRIHRRPLPVILLVTGFAIIMLGHVFLSGRMEGIIVPAGGLFIAVAHFINYRCTEPHPNVIS
ncbi:MerC domain-containing protein [Mucilaginibacter sp. OK283]|jgi:hypothetical protein|uniref:MerC domain-containing protein n=1 Tax=Mucilaginibacter sp. OK283 TaxID=1881049 RepID=UPI0008B58D2C|nr:MerC domain-containing protein [Mucilaginibacter sp. OK283]SEP03744.1 MerC mercury resistance protein [Mucilaginibacter sp. OK283]